MIQELIYTSAPRGLKPGTRGFCTVACTQQMTQPLAERLESLSGYRHLFAAHESQERLNPLIHSHLLLTVGGRKFHVLSRIADAGLDYTQRSNKFAHHVALDVADLPAGGPAWLLLQPGFMQTGWSGEPRLLPAGRRPPNGFSPPAVCRHWQALTGDAGWAGALAETATHPTTAPACLLFKPGQDLLPLVAEALSLLPVERRWQVTFSTWFTKLPPDIDCHWRFLIADSAEAKAARRQHRGLWIDLTAPLQRAASSPWAEAARTGVAPTAGPPEAKLAPVARGRVMPRHLAEAAAGPPSLSPAEFGLDLTAAAVCPPAPTLLRAPVAPRTVWKPWMVGGALAAMLLCIAVVGLIAFYAGRASETQVARDDHRPTAAPAEAAVTPRLSPAANLPATNVPAANAPGGIGGGGIGQGGPPQSRMQGAAPTGGGPGGQRDEPADAPAAPPFEATQNPPRGELDSEDGAPPDANEPAAGRPPHEAGTKQEPAQKNPFRNFPQRTNLPGERDKNSKTLGPVVTSHPGAIKLDIIGFEVFADDIHQLKIVHEDDSTWRLKTINPEFPAGFSPTDKGGLAAFQWQDNELRFNWLSNRATDNDPQDWLRNCILKLSVDGCEAQCALREPIYLPLEQLQFDSPIHSLELVNLPEPPEAIKSSAIDLELNVEAALPDGKQATVSRGKPTAPSTQAKPPSRNRSKSGRSTKDAGAKVPTSGLSSRQESKLVTIKLPFEPGRDVEIDVELKLRNGKPPIVSFANFGFWQKSPGDAPERDPLSIAEVEKWQASAETELKKVKKKLEAKRDKLKELPAAKDGQPDPDKKDRDDLTQLIGKTEVDEKFYQDEQARCVKLLELLRKLQGSVNLTVFYRLGTVGEQEMRVVLAKSKQE